MEKVFSFEYVEMRLGQFIVHAERSLFKRVNRYGSLNGKSSSVICCGSCGESYECLRDYSESHLELTIALYISCLKQCQSANTQIQNKVNYF